MSRRLRLTTVAGFAVLLAATAASAHVSVAGPAFAGKSQVLTFGVGHGCAGADTYRVEIEIPEQVMSLRALPSAWGEAEMTRNGEGSVTRVAWQKSDVRDDDDQYYQFAIRIAVPDAPFSTLYFPSTQYCRDADGEESTAVWAALPEEIEAADAGAAPEPAPALRVLPARVAGWNEYTAPHDIDDLSMFDDAQIVWAGDAAYSANPATMELIQSEDDVEVLTSVESGTAIWVKY